MQVSAKYTLRYVTHSSKVQDTKESIETRATNNVSEAIQGLVAGVNVQKSSGAAGAAVKIKIRGINTFGNTEPLCIIDGFQGSLSSVNPTNIESIEVLKDGAAAAIYGSVAANGVIIVTTKAGLKQGIKVDFTSFVNSTSSVKRIELLDETYSNLLSCLMFGNPMYC